MVRADDSPAVGAGFHALGESHVGLRRAGVDLHGQQRHPDEDLLALHGVTPRIEPGQRPRTVVRRPERGVRLHLVGLRVRTVPVEADSGTGLVDDGIAGLTSGCLASARGAGEPKHQCRHETTPSQHVRVLRCLLRATAQARDMGVTGGQ